MSLVPYALRPRGVLRRFIIRRGVVGGGRFVRPIAMIAVGQDEYVRVRALREGLMGGNFYWRVIGLILLVQGARRQVLTKTPERLAVERIRPGHHVRVSASAPRLDLSRRERRAVLARLEAEALESVRTSTRPS